MPPAKKTLAAAPLPRRSIPGSAHPDDPAAFAAWVVKTYPRKPQSYSKKTWQQIFASGLQTQKAPELADARREAHALLSSYRNEALRDADLAVLAVAERMVAHMSWDASLAPAVAAVRALPDAVHVVFQGRRLSLDHMNGFPNAVFVVPPGGYRGTRAAPCDSLRHVVCAASKAEYLRARGVAAHLRADADLFDRALLAYAFPDEPWGTADLEESLSLPIHGPTLGWLLSATSSPDAVRRFVAARGAWPVSQHALDLGAALPREDALAILGDALAKLLVRPKHGPLLKTPPRDVAAALVQLGGADVARVLAGYLANPILGPMVIAFFRDHPELGGVLEAATEGKAKLAETAARVLGKDAASESSDGPTACASEVPRVLRERPWRPRKGAKRPAAAPTAKLELLGLSLERVELPADVAPGTDSGIPERPMTAAEVATWRSRIERGAYASADRETTSTRGQRYEHLIVPDAEGLWAWNEKDAGVDDSLAWIARHGVAVIPGYARRDWQRWLAYEGADDVVRDLCCLVSPRIAPLMARIAQRKRFRRLALAWLREHAEVSAYGLIPAVLGEGRQARADAEDALAMLAQDGESALVLARVAKEYGPGAEQALAALLSRDPLAIDASPPKAPDFLREIELPEVRLKSGALLPEDARGALVELLSVVQPETPYAGVAMLRDDCDETSLAALATGLLEQWVLGDAPGRHEWMLFATVLFPSEGGARRVAALARDWARRDGAKAERACRALAALGESVGPLGDMALLHLAHVAETTRFAALRKQAAALLDEAAAARGLSRDELEDRTVPDAGLDPDGTITLSFGARELVVTLDEALSPVVRERGADGLGPRLRALPRPAKTDDAAAAKAARARFEQLGADLEAVAKRQIRRLERAMAAGRRWSVADFEARVVGHPLTTHLARRLVWELLGGSAVEPARPPASQTFRVAEDRSYAGPDDTSLELPAGAEVRIAHPAATPELGARWSTIFGDYEIAQPFEQLGRATFAATPAEREAPELARTAGVKVAAKKILGTLESRGWTRSSAGYVTAYWRRARARDGEPVVLHLPIEPGFEIQSLSDAAEQKTRAATVTHAQSGAELALGVLDEVSFSELVRDVEALRP